MLTGDMHVYGLILTLTRILHLSYFLASPRSLFGLKRSLCQNAPCLRTRRILREKTDCSQSKTLQENSHSRTQRKSLRIVQTPRWHFGENKQPKILLKSAAMKSFTFLKRPKNKMLLHHRANHAEQRKPICGSY